MRVRDAKTFQTCFTTQLSRYDVAMPVKLSRSDSKGYCNTSVLQEETFRHVFDDRNFHHGHVSSWGFFGVRPRI